MDHAANIILIAFALAIIPGILAAAWFADRSRLGRARTDEAVRQTLGRGA